MSDGLNPTGAVTFELFAPDDATCSGTPDSAFPNNPLSGGSATSGSVTTTAVGTYHWVATYNGDANNAPVSSACSAEPVDITQATPTIATTPTPSPGGPVGTPISDTATVTDGFVPTGTVTFELFGPGDPSCTGTSIFVSTNPLSGSPPSATSDPFATDLAGTYHWVATYNGDINNTSVSSTCAEEPVTIKATPTIATTPSPGGPVGTPLSDTATLTGGLNPGGTVTFDLFPPDDTTCTAPPAFTSTNPVSGASATSDSFTTTAVGTYHWFATYNGDINNTTVSSDCAEEPVTIKATPTIATTPSAGGPVGTSISDTATVNGGFNPTGTVTFDLFPPADATCSGTPAFTSTNPVSGVSATSDPFPTTAVGTYHWVANYNGDTNNTKVSSGCQDEPVSITPPQAMVTKTVTSNTQNPGGTWTIVYDVAVTNPNASIATSFTLADTLAFGNNIDVNLAKVTGAGASPSWNGATDTTIVADAALGAGATEHYTVTVNATVLAAAAASDRTCAAGGGFHNTAQVALGGVSATRAAATRVLAAAAAGSEASACADPGSPTVTKKVVSVVAGSAPGQWVVTYQVTAANATGTEVSYSLHDQLGFPAGVTVTSTSAARVHSALDGSGATASQPVPGWTGTGSGTALASDQLLAAQSKDTFTIVVGATVTSGLGGRGHGMQRDRIGPRLLQLCRPDLRLGPVQRAGVRSDHAPVGPGSRPAARLRQLGSDGLCFTSGDRLRRDRLGLAAVDGDRGRARGTSRVRRARRRRHPDPDQPAAPSLEARVPEHRRLIVFITHIYLVGY